MKKYFIVLLTLLLLLAGCSTTKVKEVTDHMSFIEAHMDEGFLTGKTDYLISAMMAAAPYDTYNELELTDYHVEDDGVSVVLKGTLGEEWVTKLSKVIKSYTMPDGSEIAENYLTENKGRFMAVRAKASPDSNFAFHVPLNTIVEVQTAWGDILYANASDTNHGNGDYLVCPAVDGKPDLSDVWVVNGAVFETTYTK